VFDKSKYENALITVAPSSVPSGVFYLTFSYKTYSNSAIFDYETYPFLLETPHDLKTRSQK